MFDKRFYTQLFELPKKTISQSINFAITASFPLLELLSTIDSILCITCIRVKSILLFSYQTEKLGVISLTAICNISAPNALLF